MSGINKHDVCTRSGRLSVIKGQKLSMLRESRVSFRAGDSPRSVCAEDGREGAGEAALTGLPLKAQPRNGFLTDIREVAQPAAINYRSSRDLRETLRGEH